MDGGTDNLIAVDPASRVFLKTFENSELVPPAWVKISDDGTSPRFRVFNPTITRLRSGYAMVYRVVNEGDDLRRLASCRLLEDFSIEQGSVTPLSDLIRFAAKDELDERALSWHADPRLVVLFGRIHLTWNDGGNRPINHQFILEMAEDGTRPLGLARELTREFSRAKIEKNWMLFEHNAECFAVYAISPHTVLNVDFSDARRVVCRDSHVTNWRSDYSDVYGVLRGSAPPVRHGNGFLSLAHSSFKTLSGRVYRACFYKFDAAPPFSVTHASSVPFELPNPYGTEFLLPRLNQDVAEVTYPVGFHVDGAFGVISYGINDERCAIARLPMADIEAELTPVSRTVAYSFHRGDVPEAMPIKPLRDQRPAVPLFWWDAKGKRKDATFGKRVFSSGNFGDIASMEVVQRLTGMRIRKPRAAERKLLSIGSVLHLAKDGDVVWGSGAKGDKAQLKAGVKALSVHAVRGPLTLDVLRLAGIDLSRVKELFDPGCLVPVLYREEIAQMTSASPRTGGYRIVPHYKDDLLLRRTESKHLSSFVSADASPLKLIESIHGSDLVISSSLHGLIFAESLGIPACWLSPRGGENERKYYDYYFGTGRWSVRRFETVDDALRSEPMQLPNFRLDDYIATFPHEEVAELALPGIPLGSHVRLSDLQEGEVDDYFDLWNFRKLGKGGIWATSNRARIQTYLSGCSGAAMLQVELVLRPFNPIEYKKPQRVEICLNQCVKASADWAPGADEPVKLKLRIPHDGSKRRFLDLVLVAANARSPKSLGLASVDDRLAACLEAMSVTVPVPIAV